MAADKKIVLQIDADTKQAQKGVSDLNTGLGETSASTGLFAKQTGFLQTAWKGVTAGVKLASTAFKSLKIAIIGTGIGALLIAMGALVTYFTSSNKGVKQLESAMAGLGGVVGVLTDKVSALGEFIISIFTNPQKAIDTFLNKFEDVGKVLKGIITLDYKLVEKGVKGIANSASDMGKELSGAASKAMDLEKAQQLLRTSNRELNKEYEVAKSKIAELKGAIADKTKTDKERIAFANEAIKIEDEISAKRTKAAEEELRIIKQQNAISDSTEEDLDAEAAAEVKLLSIVTEANKIKASLRSASSALVKKASDNYVKAKKAESDAEVELTEQIEEMQKRLNQAKINLLEEGAEREKAQYEQKLEKENERFEAEKERLVGNQEALDLLEEEHKLLKEEIKLEEEELKGEKLEEENERIAERNAELLAYDEDYSASLVKNAFNRADKQIEANRKRALAEVKDDEFAAKEKEKINRNYDKQKTTNKELQAQAEKDILNGNLDNTANALNMTSDLMGKGSEAWKAASIASAAISTYQGAAAALAPPPLGAGPILGPILAGLTIASGLANVAKISSTEIPKQPKVAPQKLALGGLVMGASHQNGGVKFNAGGKVLELEGGEAVINKASTSAFSPLLSAINSAGGGVEFAAGGVTEGGSDSSDDSGALAALLSQPIRAYVVESDITEAQNNVSTIEERASI